MQKLLKILAFLFLAMAGAALFQLVLVPFLVSNPFFGKFGVIKNLKREIIVNPTQEIIIKENQALEKAIENVEAAVFHLSSPQGQGCGFSLTSDGQVLTQASLLPKENSILVDGEKTNFRVLKKDSELDLALIKIEKGNLKTTPFADFEKVKHGEKVFLLGDNIVNEGIVKQIGDVSQNTRNVPTNIFEKESLNGCPLFTIEGQFVGLSKISLLKSNFNSSLGQVFILPIPEIRSFTGL